MRKPSQRGLLRGGGPGKGRGRLQVAARRKFYSTDVVSTADVVRTAYARRTLLHGKRVMPHHYRFVRKVLAAIADPIGRGGGRGRAMRWRIRRDMDAT
jgi:hypothetical protein